MTDPDPILELIGAYGSLTSELDTAYYLSDPDEINRLKALVDQLEEVAGIEWADGKPRWKHVPCRYGGGLCRLNARDHYHLASPGKPDEVVQYGSERDRRHRASMDAYYRKQGLA